MGQVITIPEGGMDLVLYGDKRGVITNYLYNQLQQLPNTLSDFGRSVYNGVVNSYNYMTDVFTQSNIINQLNNQQVSVINNYIQECLDFKSIQAANITMQRYIMAHPATRQLYMEQNCDAYSQSYVDIFKGQVGKDHYDYRRVTDGILMSTATGWEVNYYDETLEVGDKEPDFVDKCKILSTYEVMDWILESCKFDFTNADGETKRNA